MIKGKLVWTVMVLLGVAFLAICALEVLWSIRYAPGYTARYGTVWEYARDWSNWMPGKTCTYYVNAWVTDKINRDTIVRFFAGNFALGIPLGLMIPYFLPKMRTLGKTCAAGAAFVLTKEAVQVLLMLGSFDIDGILLSCLGMMLGYLLFAKLLRRYA